MIKRWIGLGGGLGGFTNNFDPTGLSSVSIRNNLPLPGGTSVSVVVDHTQDPISSTVLSGRAIDLVATPSALGSLPKGPVSLIPRVSPLILSEESQMAPADTFFRDFRLEAIPRYNFWTEDEITNDRVELGNRKLEDVPRYIKLVWDPAPDLGGDPLKVPKTKQHKDSPLGRRQISIGGITFSPVHLKDDNFAVVRNATANGFISPGTLASIVEVVRDDGGIVSAINGNLLASDLIDEDEFLTHPDMRGVDLHELRFNLLQTSDPISDSLKFGNGLDESGEAYRRELFEGKTMVSKPNSSQDILNLSTTDPSQPSLSLNVKTAGSVDVKIDDVANLVDIVKEKVNDVDLGSDFAAVKFVDPSLVGLVDPSIVNGMTRIEHAEATIGVSAILTNLMGVSLAMSTVESNIEDALEKLPSFPTPAGIKPVEYIGYVIEKYRMNGGEQELIDTIDIPNRTTTAYYDTKVLYGEVYRYRIRSILRWTRPDDSYVNTSTKRLAPFKSIYFHSEWSAPFVHATVIDTQPPPPPDEITVRAESHRKRISVVMKLPDDSQRDIQNLILYRKLQDLDGNDLTGWVELDRFPARNGIYFDYDVGYAEEVGVRYVYAGRSLSKHMEVSVLSEQIATRLRKDWKVLGEYGNIFVSCAGVRIENFGAFSVRPFRKRLLETIIKPKIEDEGDGELSVRIPFSGRDRFGNFPLDDSTYLIRVQSLDTGEEHETTISMKYENLGSRVREAVEQQRSAFRGIGRRTYPVQTPVTLAKLFR
jgi:hypothetical protein